MSVLHNVSPALVTAWQVYRWVDMINLQWKIGSGNTTNRNFSYGAWQVVWWNRHFAVADVLTASS